MVEELTRGAVPDRALLEKRFDAAMTKKLAVVKLPPAFWSQDPKINPRADLLFWASILIGDLQRIELAISVIAAELEEKSKKKQYDFQQVLAATVRGMSDDLLAVVNDTVFRQELKQRLHGFLHEYFQVA